MTSNLITTVSDSQSEILQNIAVLHNQSRPFQVDLTWGSGGFWRQGAAAFLQPGIRMDLSPDNPATNLQADIRELPFRPGSIQSAVIDLPFIHAPGKQSVMGQRFSGYPSQKALDELHHLAASECARALAPGGLLVWKCQDIIESSKQVWNHLRVHYHCGQVDLRAEDLFILFRTRSALIGWNQRKQQHARRTHSYFWVFRKS